MQSARPGPWRNDHAPYLAGLMDLCANRAVEELTIVKAAQIGVSETLRNVVGYYAHQEPDPVLLVLPDEHSGRKIVAQRMVPLLRDTPSLRQLFTPASRDIQLRHVTLANGFTLRLGWSGSPASLASDPCRIVINDEVDKFQPWSGRESDPITLGYARTQSYEGRRLIINCSTPTTAEGLIWKRYESAAIHLRYTVPCPFCGEYQPLAFAQLRWPDVGNLEPRRAAAQIERDRDVWYECTACHGEIRESDRAAMIRQGEWRSDEEGEIRGRVGVHLWAGYCLWIPWFRIVAESLRCRNDSVAMMGFTNSWLGEPFQHQIAATTVEVFEAKQLSSAPARRVPEWAQVLIATADTQKDHFWWVVRAWGHGYRSQRIDHGMAMTFEDLRRRALDAVYPWVSSNRPALRIEVLGIDSGGTGSRTSEVYRFALTDPQRIRATKGASHERDLPLATKRVTYRPPDQSEAPFPVFLTLVHTNHFKDRLASAISNKVPVVDPETGEILSETEQWLLNDQHDPAYNAQMASEHKVLIRKPGGKQAEVWMPVTQGAPNHYWDTETLQFAMADMMRVDLLFPVSETPEPPTLESRERRGNLESRRFVPQPRAPLGPRRSWGR